MTQDKSKIVVLGAGGFLGSALCHYFARHNFNVVAYWRRPRSWIKAFPQVQAVMGDLRDTWILAEAIKDADVVYHCASATHPSLFYSNPSAEYWEALQPLLVLMETANRYGVRKIVYPSSGGTIYADRECARTEDSPLDPKSPYAIFKIAAEHLLMHSVRQNDFQVDILRVGNPYGPGQPQRSGQGVVAHWIEAIKSGQPVSIYGDGSQERDYIYIDDFCELAAASCSRLDNSGVYNVGTGIPVSLRKLHRTFESILQRPIAVESVAASNNKSVQSICLSPEKILAACPEFRFTSLEEGLRQTLRASGLLN